MNPMEKKNTRRGEARRRLIIIITKMISSTSA
jgi:hypothetical protein